MELRFFTFREYKTGDEPSFHILMAIVLCNLAAALTQAAERKANSNPDGGVLQGKWERELSAQDTQMGLRRAEKEIKGNKETVTFYGEDNKVLRRHTVDFKLEKKADIHVFTYFNMAVTDGDGKGSRSNDPVSYVYRVVGDELFEVTGLLAGQEQQPVTVYRWKRLKTQTE